MVKNDQPRNDLNKRYTPDMNLEQTFRGQVRDILDLDIFTRDEQIFEELRRLKRQQENHV